MDHDNAIPRPVPTGWLEAIEESDADLAAGQVVPANVVHVRLDASIARMEAAQHAEASRADAGPSHDATPAKR